MQFTDAGVSEPIAHNNLAIYFARDLAAAVDTTLLTLEEGIAQRFVEVRETGHIKELTVANFGFDPVFIQAGDIVKGGRQDRVLSIDLVLPPRSGSISIAAFCVEGGRWNTRGAEDPTQFSNAKFCMPSHEAMFAMMSASPAPASQSRIWDSVSATQQSLSRSLGRRVEAQRSPSSLSLTLENETLNAAVAEYVNALQVASEATADIAGFAVAINGKVRSAQIYSSNKLFRKMWSKLLAASATKAISEKDALVSPLPSATEVKHLLTAAESGEKSMREPNSETRIDTVEGKTSIYSETRTAGRWIHRSYLIK
jgi:hypothetical protein